MSQLNAGLRMLFVSYSPAPKAWAIALTPHGVLTYTLYVYIQRTGKFFDEWNNCTLILYIANYLCKISLLNFCIVQYYVMYPSSMHLLGQPGCNIFELDTQLPIFLSWLVVSYV